MAFRKSKLPFRPRQIAFTRKAFLCVLFITAQVVFFSSTLFRIQTIEVVGNTHVQDDVVRAQAGVKLHDHLMSVPLRVVEERVRGLHWVSEVAVRRYLPGRIVIRVQERTPVLAIGRASDVGAFPHRWFVVSDDGMVLSPAGAIGDDKLPRVFVQGPLLVGRKLHAGMVAAVRDVLASLPAPVAAQVSQVRADEDGQMFLTIALLGRPVEVRLGGADQATYKFEVLQALAARLRTEGRPVAYIDLRYTDPAVGHVVDATHATAPTEAQE